MLEHTRCLHEKAHAEHYQGEGKSSSTDTGRPLTRPAQVSGKLRGRVLLKTAEYRTKRIDTEQHAEG